MDVSSNCQSTVIPAILERLNSQEARLVKAETELNDSRAFKGQLRAWKPALIAAVVTAVATVIVSGVRLATEVYWKIHHGGA